MSSESGVKGVVRGVWPGWCSCHHLQQPSRVSGWLILPIWFWNKNRENREAKWGRCIEIFLPVLSIRASLIAQLVKNPPTMQETPVWFLGREHPLEKGLSNPLQYSGLENSMDCIVHGVAKSWTWLSNLHSPNCALYIYIMHWPNLSWQQEYLLTITSNILSAWRQLFKRQHSFLSL